MNKLEKLILDNKKELTPTEVLTQFISAMNEWNSMSISLDKDNLKSEDICKIQRDALQKIFDEYLTPKDRKYSRLQALNTSVPSEYCLDTNIIQSITTEKNKTFIEVQETNGFQNRIRYTLVHKKDGWRLDKREYFYKSKDKWVNMGF